MLILSTLLEKVTAFLRNRPIPDYPRVLSLDDLFENNDPWYTRTYWAVYRFFRWNKIFHPDEIWDDIVAFWQRGRRGWADRDTWSLDNYLAIMMPHALRYLKEHKHGIPMSVFPDDPQYIKDCGNPTDEAYKVAEARWDEIMEKIIAAFEASVRMQEGLYEVELGPYPGKRPKGVTKEDWKKVRDDHYVASRNLIERDQKIFEEGFALLGKFYTSLWD